MKSSLYNLFFSILIRSKCEADVLPYALPPATSLNAEVVNRIDSHMGNELRFIGWGAAMKLWDERVWKVRTKTYYGARAFAKCSHMKLDAFSPSSDPKCA